MQVARNLSHGKEKEMTEEFEVGMRAAEGIEKSVYFVIYLDFG